MRLDFLKPDDGAEMARNDFYVLVRDLHDLSLLRRHRHNLRPEQHSRLAHYLKENPALEVIYRFKQRLCYLLLEKHLTRKKCAKLIPRLLRAIAELRSAILPSLVQLGNTLHASREEIATMWRFTRNNGITEGFHTTMEVLNRQAYSFRNLPELQIAREGNVFLASSLSEAAAPIKCEEPKDI
ncbi:MAG TPA: transposase [Bryobacteraceae bacterium]